MVPNDLLLQVARSLKEEGNYIYLSSLTGVDYLPEQTMEVVYHFRKLTGGEPLVLKVQTDREDAHVQSLVSLFPGADFQEREAWDLLGIRFDGHPNLKRILSMGQFRRSSPAQGLEGTLLRRGCQTLQKPLAGRPKYQSEESRNPFGDNAAYPR